MSENGKVVAKIKVKADLKVDDDGKPVIKMSFKGGTREEMQAIFRKLEPAVSDVIVGIMVKSAKSGSLNDTFGKLREAMDKFQQSDKDDCDCPICQLRRKMFGKDGKLTGYKMSEKDLTTVMEAAAKQFADI